MYARVTACLVAVGILCLSACGSLKVELDQEEIDRSISRLQRELVAEPDNPDILRDLGALMVQSRRYADGRVYLQRAFADRAADPKTLFYLGLASEELGDTATALRLYGKFASFGIGTDYRRVMRGRYESLTRELVRRDLRALLARESELSGDRVSPQTVAVLPLNFRGGDPKYRVLGRGLSEIITADLASVRALTVVERIRLQTLLDELALSESEYVDPATSPRVGRLLGAGRLVGGNYDILGKDLLRVDMALLTVDESIPIDKSDELENLFRLEKEIVFDLLNRMDITLSPEERDEIERIPTQNLQAFLAYSLGLQSEDEGDYAGAARQYRRAARIDPAFSAAVDKQDQAESMEAAQGGTDQVLSQAAALETPLTAATDLVSGRIEAVSTNLGTTFTPGQEAREPAAEVAVATGGRLPDPPQPPPRGQ